MKLVHRISVFFLVAMAVILAATSAAMYGLLRYQLTSQLEADVRQAFNTLVAAVEVEEDDVKWEPGDHTIALGGARPISWCVIAPDGRVVDESADDDLAEDLTPIRLLTGAAKSESAHHENGWRYWTRRLSAPQPKPAEERDVEEFAALTIAVGHPAGELDATLNTLALASTALPLVVWGVFALVGRWVCARAIRPLSVMAEDARTMSIAEPAARLSLPPQRDELYDLGAAFNGALDRWDEALARQASFVGNAAHQLRTPLAALLGQLEVTLRRERKPEEYVAALERARQESGNLHRILEALLFLARTSRDSARDAFQTIDLAEWLPRYAERWRGHARWNELEFHAARGARIDAPAELLRQLLDNLIDNALKYSPAGGPVCCEALLAEGRTTLSVTDHGIGISPEETSQLFQPFFRSAESRRLGIRGDGLGLATAREIAHMLGGELTAEPVSPCGTRFLLDVPHSDAAKLVSS